MYIVETYFREPSTGVFHWMPIGCIQRKYRSRVKADAEFDALVLHGWDRVVIYKSVKGSALTEIRRGGRFS